MTTEERIEQLTDKLLDATNKIHRLEDQAELLAIRHNETIIMLEARLDAVNKRMTQLIRSLD